MDWSGVEWSGVELSGVELNLIQLDSIYCSVTKVNKIQNDQIRQKIEIHK